MSQRDMRETRWGKYIVLTSTEFGLPPAAEFVGWGVSPIPCLMREGEKEKHDTDVRTWIYIG